MPTYLFLRVYASSDALMLPICFHWSVTVWLLYRYLLDFIVLPSFYCLVTICLFSLLCSFFVAKMLGRPWLLKIMLWSGGAVNLLIRFWPALCYIFDLIFRAEYLGFLWLVSCGFVVVWKRTMRAFQWCQDRMDRIPGCQDIASWSLGKKYGL